MKLRHKLHLAVKVLREKGDGLCLTKYRSRRNSKVELIVIKRAA